MYIINIQEVWEAPPPFSLREFVVLPSGSLKGGKIAMKLNIVWVLNYRARLQMDFYKH